MERISVTMFFCVALILGIIWQAPPHVYKKVSSYYDTLKNGKGSVQGANGRSPATRKAQNKKPSSKRLDNLRTASFNPLDRETSDDRSESDLNPGAATADSAHDKDGTPPTSARKPAARQDLKTTGSKRD